MATGKIIQATEGPNLGSAFLANKTNRMFVSRKEKENWNMYVMDLNKFFADVKQGKVGKPSAYETFIGTFPTEMGRPGGYAVDCNDDYAYITVEREGTEEEKERMMKNAFLPESNQPVKIKPTLCGIRKMNLSTGEVTKVIDDGNLKNGTPILKNCRAKYSRCRNSMIRKSTISEKCTGRNLT